MHRTIYILIFLLLSATVFSQTVTEFEGTGNIEDAWLRETAPTTNYGGASDITGRIQANLFSAEVCLFRLVNIDDSIPTDAIVRACTLVVYAVVNSGTGTPTLHEVCPDWVETQTTWNIYSTGNNWTTAGCNSASGSTCDACGSEDRKTSDIGTAFSGTGYQKLPIDSCLAQSWIDGTKSNGVVLRSDGTKAITLYQSEASSSFYVHWIVAWDEASTGVPSVRHSPDGNGVRHSPDGASVRHGE